MKTGKIEPQGWGEILPGLGAEVVQVLIDREGVLTQVYTDDGSVIDALSCVWGRDFGEMWEHVYLNMRPHLENETVHFVQTSDIIKLIDPISGHVLYNRPSSV